MYGKGRSRVKAVQMDNFRGLLGIMRMDKVPNARIRELCKVKKGLDKRIDEGVLRWFGHVESVYVGECVGNHSVGRPWRKWTDTVKECLKQRGLQTRRMVQDRSK